MNVVLNFDRIAQHLEPCIYCKQESTLICSYRTVYRVFEADTIFALFPQDIFKWISILSLFSSFINVINKYLTLWLNFLVCLYRGWDGGDGYLESDFCWKIQYVIQSLCPHGHRKGGSARCIEVWTGRGESKITNWKCAHIFYGWSLLRILYEFDVARMPIGVAVLYLVETDKLTSSQVLSLQKL